MAPSGVGSQEGASTAGVYASVLAVGRAAPPLCGLPGFGSGSREGEGEGGGARSSRASLGRDRSLANDREKLCPEKLSDVIFSPAGDSEPLICPVVQDRQGQKTWEPWDRRLVKELRAVISTSGLGNLACNAVLDMLQAELSCPFDWRNLVKTVITPAQMVLFESRWESLTLESTINNNMIVQGHPLHGVGSDQLWGVADFVDPCVQRTWDVSILW